MAMHPRKKKNALYRKVVKSIVKARGKKCPTKCVENLKELGLLTYNVCLGCPYLFASPYHPQLKKTTLKRVKPDLKEMLWLYGE